MNKHPINLEDLFLTGLRRREGITFQEATKGWGWDENQRITFLAELEKRWIEQMKNGLIKRRGQRIFLSDPQGMNLSNQILVDMILWWESLPKSAVDPPIL